MDQESKRGTSAVAGPRWGLFTALWVGGWLIARVQSLAQLLVFCFRSSFSSN